MGIKNKTTKDGNVKVSKVSLDRALLKTDGDKEGKFRNRGGVSRKN